MAIDRTACLRRDANGLAIFFRHEDCFDGCRFLRRSMLFWIGRCERQDVAHGAI